MRKRHRTGVVVLVALAVASGGVMPAVATFPTSVRTSAPKLGIWHVPGDTRGGYQVFDGFTVSDDMSKYGDYSLIYYYPANDINKEQCESFTEDWRKEDEKNGVDIRRFRDDGKLNPVYLREKDRFVVTGTPLELPPNGRKKYETTKSSTHTVSLSYSVTSTGTVDKGVVKAQLETKFEAKYQYEVTSTTKETTEEHNPHPQYTRVYNSGIYRDVIAIQQQPWRAKWYPHGSRIYAGSDATAFARWYKVRKAGCYRSAVFDSAVMPKRTQVRLIGEYLSIKGDTAKTRCPNQALGEDTWTYEKTTMEEYDDDGFPNLEPFTIFTQKTHLKPKVVSGQSVPHCLVLSGLKNTDTGETFRELLEPAEYKGQWVLEDQIADSTGEAKPLEGWSPATVMSIRPASDTSFAMKRGDDSALIMQKVADGKTDDAAKWKLHTPRPGFWAIRAAGQDRCIDRDEPVVRYYNCVKGHGQQEFRLLRHQDDVFYIQENTNNASVIHVRDDPVNENTWPFVGELKETDKFRWQFVEER